MHCEIFTDAFYHGDQHIDIDPAQVASAEERTVRLFLRGSHAVTQARLRDGREFLLRGSWAAQIEAAREEASQAEAT